MVFRKRTSRRPRPVRRRYRRKAFRKAVSKIAKKAVRASAETKYVDHSASTTDIPQVQAPLQYTLTSSISVGTADNGNRIGDKITLRSIDLRYLVTPNSSYTALQGAVRVVIVKYMSPSWFSTFYTDVLQSPSNGLISMCAPFNHDNRRKFHVLYDRVHKFDLNGSNSAFVRKMISLKNTTCGFSASGATCIQNDIRMYVYDSGLTASGTQHQFNYNVRLNYIDL